MQKAHERVLTPQRGPAELSGLRIVRDDGTRESPGLIGLYPVGDGAGYAGGIVSAAVDGLRTARAIIARYAPVK